MRGSGGEPGARRRTRWAAAVRLMSWAALPLALLGAAGGWQPAHAQADLGGQRVGTSSGTFLKIPLDARGSAMAGATCPWVSGPAALFWNPAGLGIENERAVLFSAIAYPGEIPIGAAAVSFPFDPLGGALGFAVAGLSAEMDETDEYHPLGTGRSFSYRSWAVIVGGSSALTDKLSFGISAKLYHEALGTEVGGPQLTAWLLDAGATYFVGYRDARIGIALSDFGPDLRPGGEFTSRRNGAEIRYTSFSPPTVFRFGASIDPWTTDTWKIVTVLEMGHPADNRELVRVGAEATFRQLFALRGGYDLSADALNLHAGFGARVRSGDQLFGADYSFSSGGYFGDVHRWTLQVHW
jgi:hypothetical protein